MVNLLIIGGSDAGISAALRAREVDGTADVTEKGLSPPQAAGFQPWRLGVCGLSPCPLLLIFRSISLHIFPQRHKDFTVKGTGMLLCQCSHLFEQFRTQTDG